RRRRVAVAVIYTIPSLALLVFMIPLLGIGRRGKGDIPQFPRPLIFLANSAARARPPSTEVVRHFAESLPHSAERRRDRVERSGRSAERMVHYAERLFHYAERLFHYAERLFHYAERMR